MRRAGCICRSSRPASALAPVILNGAGHRRIQPCHNHPDGGYLDQHRRIVGNHALTPIVTVEQDVDFGFKLVELSEDAPVEISSIVEDRRIAADFDRGAGPQPGIWVVNILLRLAMERAEARPGRVPIIAIREITNYVDIFGRTGVRQSHLYPETSRRCVR